MMTVAYPLLFSSSFRTLCAEQYWHNEIRQVWFIRQVFWGHKFNSSVSQWFKVVWRPGYGGQLCVQDNLSRLVRISWFILRIIFFIYFILFHFHCIRQGYCSGEGLERNIRTIQASPPRNYNRHLNKQTKQNYNLMKLQLLICPRLI